jgi:hypothetical protein
VQPRGGLSAGMCGSAGWMTRSVDSLVGSNFGSNIIYIYIVLYVLNVFCICV